MTQAQSLSPCRLQAGLGKLLDSLVGSAPPAAESAASIAQAYTQDFTPVVLNDLVTVRAHRQQAVDTVCAAQAVPQAVALKLLQHHSWDVWQAVTACRRNLAGELRLVLSQPGHFGDLMACEHKSIGDMQHIRVTAWHCGR